MKSDITRYTFNPKNHFTSVRSQQGRVPLDAELNETQDIQNHLNAVTRRDTIGHCGVPLTGGGFALSLLEAGGQQDFAISPGRMYVDGELCEAELGGAIAVQIRSANTLAVTARQLDGEPFEAGQRVELWSEGNEPQRLRLSAITAEADSEPSTFLLSLEPAISNPAALTRPLLRRLSTLLFQPDYPASFPAMRINQPAALPDEPGIYLAYLDVWQQHITALEDPQIREIALGGSDTTTRLKTVSQVKLTRVADLDADPPPQCRDFGSDWAPIPAALRRLKARAMPNPTSDRPCIVPAQAGYRRLENQLYRVEIHRSGDASTATFKWSRDNATLVTAWTGPDTANASTLAVDSLGFDSVRRFQPDQWVEITDSTRDLHNQPGSLVRLENAVDQTLVLAGNATRADFPRLAKIFAWDHQATVAKPDGAADIPLALVEGAIPVLEGNWIELEDGVQIFFEPGGSYTTGDYWLVPARVIGASLLWPQDDSGEPILEPPLGITHHYCRLALLRRQETGWSADIVDCRPAFPPLIDLLNVQTCGEIVVRPGDDLQAIVDRIPNGGSARLCLHPGIWELSETVTIANKGNLILSGAGAATQLTTSVLDRTLLFSQCESVTIRDLAIQGGAAGIVGDGLQGTVSCIDCGSTHFENVFVTCNASTSRRASAIQVWARSSEQLTNVTIEKCHVSVGHAQTGILIINANQVTVSNNRVETVESELDLSEAIADPLVAAAAGRILINRILVGNEFEDDRINQVINRGDFGLGEPIERIPDEPALAGQVRLVGQLSQWGSFFFVFSTDPTLSPTIWTDILLANPILPPTGGSIRAAVVATRLRQLRARLIRRLLGDTTVSVTIPPIAGRTLDILANNIRTRNTFTTGGQGIVIGGNRTPRFGETEPAANGLFIRSGDRAPNVHITHNQVTGFAEGIHIGTSDTTPRRFRSYHTYIAGNTIQLQATDLAQTRHGIFVGNAHTVQVQDNLIEMVTPNPSDALNPRLNQSPVSPPPTDGIHLFGIYGPMLQIRQNHCIGVTCGIRVNGRNAGKQETHHNVFSAWSVTNNAYAGAGQPEVLFSQPTSRF
jgi:hypothetical protein